MGEVILCILREGLLGLDGAGGMLVQTSSGGRLEIWKKATPREKRLNGKGQGRVFRSLNLMY